MQTIKRNTKLTPKEFQRSILLGAVVNLLMVNGIDPFHLSYLMGQSDEKPRNLEKTLTQMEDLGMINKSGEFSFSVLVKGDSPKKAKRGIINWIDEVFIGR